ncbi:hypothetical protein M514_00810 [Trichuris suis]|uniref:Uncharacterized protein n=1 Tax=Trichuris suis TaxID=68888 RepID=A0A085N989_9BILA|nr:hypothetical protein M514_00810 [Trichuris suis]
MGKKDYEIRWGRYKSGILNLQPKDKILVHKGLRKKGIVNKVDRLLRLVAQREENSQSTAPGFESRPRTGSSLRRRQDVFLSRNAQEFSTSLQQLLPLNGEQWPRAVMDNASDFRFEDCTFGSSPGRLTSAENFLS